MYYFGSNEAKGFYRGNFTNPSKIKGLKGLMIIWQKVNNVVKNIPWYKYISNINTKYSELSNDVISIELEIKNKFFWWDYEKIIIEYRG